MKRTENVAYPGGKGYIDPQSPTGHALSKASTFRKVQVAKAQYSNIETLFDDIDARNIHAQSDGDFWKIEFNAKTEDYDRIQLRVTQKNVS
ncbi:MAG: hypothetical protein KBB70_02960 [Candidatus Pacebacteria bacterium]|nr:hypothetical protein [Candidatus Paceibacterota bacterium]